MILCLCPNPSVDTYSWINSFNPTNVNRAWKEERFPGGKGVHVAMAASELGEEVVLLSFWGGPTGIWIKQQCEQKGIKCIGPNISEWTRTCICLKTTDEYDDTEILGSGPILTQADIDNFISDFEKVAPEASCVTMSGSWPPGAKGDEYAHLIDISNRKGIPVFLDCTGPQLENSLVKKPHLIHLNQSEAKSIFNEDDPVILSGKLARKCNVSALTAGADGLYLMNEERVVHTKCHLENIISAVGSGDCLLAGLAVAYLRGLNFLKTAILATACGSANCINPDLGMIKRSEAEELLNKVQIIKEQSRSFSNEEI